MRPLRPTMLAVALSLVARSAHAQDASLRDAGPDATADASMDSAAPEGGGMCPTYRDAGNLSADAPFPDGRPRPQPNHCPNVVLVLDNSCSMSSPAGPLPDGGRITKWVAAVNAISSLLDRVGTSVRFGLSLFPCSHCAADCSQPTLAQALPVEPAAASNDQVRRTLGSAARSCSTPTPQYLNAVAQDPELYTAERSSYLVLITDGQPTCRVGNDSNQGSTELALARLAAQGVPTFVVGFDQNVDVNALNCYAQVGGRPQSGAATRFYNARDQASLQAALDDISSVVLNELGAERCDESCYSLGCPDGQVCMNMQCRPDPCASVSCPAEQFCELGRCVSPCANGCPSNQVCTGGLCVNDPCANLSCAGCISGVCPAAGCLNADGTVRDCGPGRVCRGAICIDDPCLSVNCPSGYRCDRGGCVPRGDGGVRDAGTGGNARGACGCRAPGAPTTGGGLAALALCASLATRRRRRR